jgi:hypothetical protein
VERQRTKEVGIEVLMVRISVNSGEERIDTGRLMEVEVDISFAQEPVRQLIVCVIPY